MNRIIRYWILLIIFCWAAFFPVRDGVCFNWGPRADVIGENFGRSLHAGGAINNKIYIAGGGYIGTTLWESHNSTIIYDPVNNTWSDGAAMVGQQNSLSLRRRTSSAASVPSLPGLQLIA